MCKSTEKVVNGVACSVRWQAIRQRFSAFRESVHKKFPYDSKAAIGHAYSWRGSWEIKREYVG